MAVQSPPGRTFRDLALALTEEERRSLLRKISASLSLPPVTGQPLFQAGYEDQARRDVIMEEIAGLGLWERLRYFLRRLFSTRNSEQTYIDFRLAELRRRARRVRPSLGPLYPHSVSADIARAAWELYRHAYAVIPLFVDLWRSGSYLQEAIEHLLSERIPEARSELLDFVSMDEMQQAFMRNEMKADVRKLVVDRLGEYLDRIPADVFSHLAEGLLPLYHLRPVTLLDYNALFDVFGFAPGTVPPGETPPFRDAPTSAALPVVESLYYGVYAATRMDESVAVHSEVLDHYLTMKELEKAGPEEESARAQVPAQGPSPEDAVPDDAAKGSARRREIHELSEHIQELHRAVSASARGIPFADLIRYYSRDPWRRIRAFRHELRLYEFYQSYLMIRLLSRLDQTFPAIRAGVVSRMTEQLFGEPPPALQYFRPGVQQPPRKGDLPGFRHMQSVHLCTSFLRRVYRQRLQDVARTLTRVLGTRLRESAGDIVANLSGIEEALKKLEEFDRSFAPDSDNGKAFYRVRYGVEKDGSFERSYRNLVQQFDRESATMVDAVTSHLRGLDQALASVERGLTDQLRERYAEADSRVNALDGLDRLLETERGKLRLFDRLIRQVRSMEEGY